MLQTGLTEKVVSDRDLQISQRPEPPNRQRQCAGEVLLHHGPANSEARNHEPDLNLTIMAAHEYQYNEESKSIQLLNVAPMAGDHVPAARVAGLRVPVAENLARILQRRLDRHQRRRCKPHDDHKTPKELYSAAESL